MAFNRDPEQEAMDAAREKAEIEVAERQQKMMWEHEKEMLHIQLVEGRKVEGKLAMGKWLERVCVSLVKLPTLLILCIFVPLIVLAGKEVPEFLQRYMSI